MQQQIEPRKVEKVKEKINSWVELIATNVNELQSLKSDTENDFLSTGSKLNEYKSLIDKIINQSLSVSKSFAVDDMTQNAQKMKEQVINLINFIKEVENKQTHNIDLLKNVNDYLALADESLSGFKKIVKTLKMLSVSTQIEAARLGSNDSGFNALAEDVEKLSTDINEKTLNIHKDTLDLKSYITSTIGLNTQLSEKQTQHTKLTTEQLSSNIDLLDIKNQKSEETALFISENSGFIKRNINEVVTAIQFHDITRQQIEHVEHSLKELVEQFYQNNFASDIEIVKFSALLRDVSFLEMKQIQGSANQFDEAVQSIKMGLKNLLNDVANISQGTDSLLSDKKQGDNFLDDLGNSLNKTIDNVKEDSKISSELLNSLTSVSQTVKKLADYTKLIEEIGEEVELIALNASVKAAHTGKEGAALGVIADAIQKLSTDALEQTRIVSSPFREITNIAEKLTNENLESDKDSEMFMEISRELEKSLSLIKEKSEHTSNALAEILLSVLRLQEEINSQLLEFNINEKVQSVIFKIKESLRNLNSDIVYVIGQECCSDSQEKLDKLEKRYTMLSEREIHHSIMDTGKSKHTKKIDAKAETINYMENDLGDNVELF